MGDEESAITVIIENNLQRYIKILRENGLDKKNKAEYIAKVYLYIGELCREYNFNSSLFLKIFLTPKFVDKYDPTLREAFPREVSWNEGSDRKIRKNHNWKFFQL